MKTTSTLAMHIKYKDNSETAFFIPLSKISFLVSNGKARLTINHKIKPLKRDLFFCSVLYTDDPKCHPKGLIINLGYIVLRIRLTMCKVISYSPFVIETDTMDNSLFQWKLPLRIPTIKTGSNIKVRDLGIAKQGTTKFEWDIKQDNYYLLKYSFFIPKENLGFHCYFESNMDSIYNRLNKPKPDKKFKRLPKDMIIS